MDMDAAPQVQCAEEIVGGLCSPERVVRMDAVRRLKNKVIGSKQRKSLYLAKGAVPRLCELLVSGDSEIAVHAASALGSFAHGSEEHVRQVCQPEVIQALTTSLFCEDELVVASCCRSLKIFYQTGIPSAESLLQSCDDPVSLLVGLLSRSEAAAESAASLLVCCCEAKSRRLELLNAGGVEALLRLVAGQPLSRSLYAALSAISELSSRFADFVEGLASAPLPANHFQAPNLVALLCSLERDERGAIRLLASTVLVNFVRFHAQGYQFVDTHSVSVSLVKLIHDNDPFVRARAAKVLSHLLLCCEDLHELGQHEDVVKRLVVLLSPSKSEDLDTSVIALMREGSLSAIAALCSRREENRRTVLQTDVLQHLVLALQDPSPAVRVAAANCARSLSRSVKSLRTSLMDAGVATPLFSLLLDSHTEVQASACAALCNMVMEFAPMKKVVLERGGVRVLAGLLKDDHVQGILRLNAVWALKNLLYEADSGEATKTKAQVLEHLGPSIILSLLEDCNTDVQEQALGLLRNLVYGKKEEISKVIRACGGTERVLSALAPHIVQSALEQHTKTASQALYALSNIASSTHTHKTAVLSHPHLLNTVRVALTSESVSVVVPALWVVINLAWREDTGSAERVVQLRQMGFVDAISHVRLHHNQDIQERAKTALDLLEGQ